jgi:2-keto-4-pentenoate hydratase/2-oxohepta-3-ene-1,7-dioic acid hydratase in catechol pathway
VFVSGLLDLTLATDDGTVQRASTADLIFDIVALVAAASRTTPLLSGDVVLTGRIPGDDPLVTRPVRPTDVVEAHITGLGRHRIVCVAAD